MARLTKTWMELDVASGIDELYQEIVLDHYKRPRNHQLLQDASLKSEGFNPFCGDRVVLTAEVSDSNRISNVGFTGQGCAISQASASIMTGLLIGLTLEEAQELVGRFKGMMRGEELSKDEEEAMGELAALDGVKKFPIRIKCALLGWSTLQDGIAEYRRQHTSAAE